MGPLLGKGRRREIPQPGMPPLTVVEELDVLRDLSSGLFARGVAPVMYQFVLPRPPKAFHGGIVITVPPPRHRDVQTELFQPNLVVLRAILSPAIRVMQQPGGRALGGENLPERPPHQVRRHSRIHRMADHLTGEQIRDAGEIQPTFRSRHVRDVGDPRLKTSTFSSLAHETHPHTS